MVPDADWIELQNVWESSSPGGNTFFGKGKASLAGSLPKRLPLPAPIDQRGNNSTASVVLFIISAFDGRAGWDEPPGREVGRHGTQCGGGLELVGSLTSYLLGGEPVVVMRRVEDLPVEDELTMRTAVGGGGVEEVGDAVDGCCI